MTFRFAINYYLDMIKHINTNENDDASGLLPEYCSECLELMRAMSDNTRQEIITLFMRDKEVCVTDIAKNFTLSRPTISHHLNLMKRVKLLNSRKDGKEVYYSFNKKYVVDMMTGVLESIKKL